MREMFCYTVDRVLLKVFAGMSYSRLRLKKNEKGGDYMEEKCPDCNNEECSCAVSATDNSTDDSAEESA